MFNLSIHPIFQDPALGTNAWWDKISHIGTPLCIYQQTEVHIIFIVRGVTYPYYFIDVYSHTPHIREQLTAFERINKTDIFVWATTLPTDWLGSYCIVGAYHAQPPKDVSLRAWWIQLLKTQNVQDIFNPYTYKTYSKYHSILDLPSCIDKTLKVKPSLQSFKWLSQHTKKIRKVWFFDARNSQDTTCQIVVLFDGAVWAKELSILSKIQVWRERNLIQSCFFVFIDQINLDHRYEDLGANPAFIDALFKELFPLIQHKCKLKTGSNYTLVGESLGGLCALYAATQYPKQIQQIFALSSSLWWQNIEEKTYLDFKTYFKEKIQTLNPQLKINLAAGHLETDMRADTQNFVHVMKKHLQIEYTEFYGGHDWACWHVALINGLYKQLKKEVCNVTN